MGRRMSDKSDKAPSAGGNSDDDVRRSEVESHRPEVVSVAVACDFVSRSVRFKFTNLFLKRTSLNCLIFSLKSLSLHGVDQNSKNASIYIYIYIYILYVYILIYGYLDCHNLAKYIVISSVYRR